MINTTQAEVEKELSTRTGHTVTFSQVSYYNPDDFIPFREVYVDGQKTEVKMSLSALVKDEKNNLEMFYEAMTKKIQQYLIERK